MTWKLRNEPRTIGSPRNCRVAKPRRFTVESVTRLRSATKITYYLGWIAAVLAAIAHFFLGRHSYEVLNLSKRNLFEASALCFLISIASELRCRFDVRSNVISRVVRKQAAKGGNIGTSCSESLPTNSKTTNHP